MDQITRAQLVALASAGPSAAVSIFLPTARFGPETEGDPLRLRNLISSARGQLLMQGLDMGEADKLLAPAEEICADASFWKHSSDGLALFLSADTALRLRLPLTLPELAVCGPRFHLRPLLPMLSGNGAYIVCAASQNEVRVFLGNRDGLDEIDVPGAPPSVAVANQYEEHERFLGYHTGAPSRGGRMGAMFYGMGSKSDEEKGDIEEFARQLAKALDEMLSSEDAPLVLCGVEALVAMLRNRLNYRHVVDGAVIGNPDDFSPAELHERAWPLAAPRFEAARSGAQDEYAALAGTGKTASGLEETLAAAADGRIDSLFIAADSEIWGSFDENKRQVSVGDRETLGGVDLLDLAAALTLQHGGDAYVLEAGQMPGGSSQAALLRY